MKKLFSVFSAAFFVSLLSFSQTVNLSWGPEKKIEKRVDDKGFVGQFENFFYTSSIDHKILKLAKYRKDNMSKVFEVPLDWESFEVENNGKNITYNTLKFFKKNFIIFLDVKDRDKDKEMIYAQKINLEGKYEGGFKKLDEKEKGGRKTNGSLDLTYAEDSTHFLLVRNPNYEKYSNEKFNFKIFNSNLELKHNLEVTLPFKDKMFSLKETHLSKDNIIYLLAKIDISKDEAKKNEARHYYEIVSIDPNNGAQVKLYDLKLDNKDIDQVTINFDKNDNIKCLGFYADLKENGKSKDGINGIFYCGLNKETKKVEKASTKDFSTKLVEELSGKRRARNDKGIEWTFKLKYFLQKDNGGSVALMEEEYIDIVTNTMTNGQGGVTRTTSYYYYNNEILAIHISPEGKITDFVSIPKEQLTINDGGRFNSFYATNVNNKTFIIYNDDKKNAITKGYEYRMSKINNSEPVMVTLNESGKTDKVALVDGKTKADFVISPKYSDKISTTGALFYGYKLSKKFCCFGGKGSQVYRYGLFEVK